MKKDIKSELKTIKGIFEIDRSACFIVPEYQRAYNWRHDAQCDKLWRDIRDYIENTSKDKSYFFGSIIVNHKTNELILIDGQQRVTTFMLLLKAFSLQINKKLGMIKSDPDSEKVFKHLETRRNDIIKCLYKVDEDDIVDIVNGDVALSSFAIKYLNVSINEKQKDEVKKILLGKDFRAIESVVLKQPYKRNDNKYSSFFRNFKFFYDRLDEFDSTELNTYARQILDSCQVIIITSYDTEEAIEIFNSLNSTGLPLTDADILSAKLYSKSSDKAKKFEDLWKEIIDVSEYLENEKVTKIDEILNQYMYINRAKNYTTESDTTLPSLRRYFTDIHSEMLDKPLDFATDIGWLLTRWSLIHSNANKNCFYILQSVFLKFNSNFKLFYMPYMFLRQDDSKEISIAYVNALLKLFILLEIVEVGYSSAKFKTFLFQMNMDIGKGIPTPELISKIYEHINKNFDILEIKKILGEIDASGSIIFLNEVLFAVENKFSTEFLTRKTYNIEHIMPASGKEIDGIRMDAGIKSIDEFNSLVNRIGNKILLEENINKSAGRDSFIIKKKSSVKKKSGYDGSIYPIAKSLSNYKKDKWGKDDIEQATQMAAERISNYIFNSESVIGQ